MPNVGHGVKLELIWPRRRYTFKLLNQLGCPGGDSTSSHNMYSSGVVILFEQRKVVATTVVFEQVFNLAMRVYALNMNA